MDAFDSLFGISHTKYDKVTMDPFDDVMGGFQDPFMYLPPSPMAAPEDALEGGDTRGRPDEAPPVVSLPDPANATGDQTLIWGTNIDIDVFSSRFKKYTEEHLIEKLVGRVEAGAVLVLDMAHIAMTDDFVYQALCRHPTTCLTFCEVILADYWYHMHRGLLTLEDVIQRYPKPVVVSPFNVPEVSLTQLTHASVERLVSVRGIVVRTTMMIPEMLVAEFRCEACMFVVKSNIDRGKIFEPARCTSCGGRGTFRLMHHLCQYEDKQLVRLQETPEDMRAGETPSNLTVVVYNALVDQVVPGDVIVATGVYRVTPVRINPNKAQCYAVVRSHIDAVHLRRLKKRNANDRMNEETEEFLNSLDGAEVTEVHAAEIQRLREMSERADIYDLLKRSLAPSVYGLDDAKNGLLTLLFGGTVKQFESSSCRGEINVLLCGDPGLAKSQLLSHVHRVSHRGVYVSGRSSTAVGLTAYIVKDADTGERILESGALVLSDGGVCCIDEFDKMDSGQRNVLKEVMEHHTLSIAKAGIVCQLNARASILAAANPRESKWDKTLTVVENLNLDPSILSRFDLIYLMLDDNDEEFHRSLTRHLIAMFGSRDHAVENLVDPLGVMTSSDLTKYIVYARAKVHPRLTVDAQQELVNTYCVMRGMRALGVMSPTLRTLESLIRLAEARARMRWSANVTRQDVLDARSLVHAAWGSVGVDVSSGGAINFAKAFGGQVSEGKVEQLTKRIVDIIKGQEGKTSIAMEDLRRTIGGRSNKVTLEDIAAAIKVLDTREFIAGFDAKNVYLHKKDAAPAGSAPSAPALRIID